MKIQKAVEACREVPESFARPLSWGGTGRAVDLAQRFRPDRISSIIGIRGIIAYASEWHVVPEDILDEWEIVKLDILSQEQEAL